MFLNNFIFALVVVSIYPNCLADNSDLKPFLEKAYKLASSDSNFDAVLKELEIGLIKRTIYKLAKPTLKLTWSNDTDLYTLSEQGTFLGSIVAFQLGKEFPEKTVDGRQVMATFTLQGTTLKEVQTKPGKPTLVIYRTFSAEHVEVKIEIADITSFRVYNAVS